MRPKQPAWLVAASGQGEFFTEERCHITELMNDPGAGVSLAVARVEPGTTTQLHALAGVSECYVIRSGCGLMEVDGEAYQVACGDQVRIAAGAAQRITNTGSDDLEFYCVCTPAFTPGCYRNLEGS